MAHSKRNTSLAFFTAHERAELKGIWGSRATRLNRESFLPFGSCNLCLLPARQPVACPDQGHLFCRECAVSNLLAQSAEIKRLKQDAQRRLGEDAEDQQRDDAEADARALLEFEMVQAGLLRRSGGTDTSKSSGVERIVGRSNGKIVVERTEPASAATAQGTKRKFELDEEELLRLAQTDRENVKRRMAEEQSAKSELPSFWVPGETPDNKRAEAKAIKAHPTCPAATPDRTHDFSLKLLVGVHFHESDDAGRREGQTNNADIAPAAQPADHPASSAGAESATRMCPSCHKNLSNSTKAILAKPCGHVLCKACSDKFQQPAGERSAHEQADPMYDAVRISCYVCQEDVTPGRKVKRKKKNAKDDESGGKAKDHGTRGLVEITSDGTGFAGGGKNMVKKEGVAFQC